MQYDLADRLWRYLRRGFPQAICVCLMPEHVHVICLVDDVQRAWARFRSIVGAATRGFGRGAWRTIPRPDIVQDRLHLRRTVRYAALNPCRHGLAPDPLQWLWTTHLDVMGAVLDPWVSADRLADALGHPRSGFTERFHRYVSSDPSVHVAGTPPPRVIPAGIGAIRPLGDIRRAVEVATRSPVAPRVSGSRPRRIMVRLALRQGYEGRSNLLADACSLSVRTVQREAARFRAAPGDSPDLFAAASCLGDARLLAAARWLEPPRLEPATVVSPSARGPKPLDRHAMLQLP